MTALVTALTEDFTLGEFIVSREYPHLASQVRDCLTETDKIKCFLLARLYLQNVRNQYKSAITILSGKRSFELNKAIGGSSTSDHLFLRKRQRCRCLDQHERMGMGATNLLSAPKIHPHFTAKPKALSGKTQINRRKNNSSFIKKSGKRKNQWQNFLQTSWHNPTSSK